MGGVSVVLKDLIHLLDRDLFSIDVLVLHNHGTMLEDLPNGTNVIFGTPYFSAIDYTIKEVIAKRSLSLLWFKLRIIFDLKTGIIKNRIKKQRKKCLKQHYDVEIAFKDGFTALFTAYGNTPKKIHWLHCSYESFNPNANYESLFRDALPRFQAIIGVTSRVVKEFNELYHLDYLTTAIPIAMNVERIQSLALSPARVHLNHEMLQIAVIGRMHPVKGYERMIEVFKSLLPESCFDDVEVHIFGDGPLFKSIQKQILDAHLEAKVFLEGQIDNPYAELKNYDFLLLPSYSEAFGTVISEAFILGVPVLSTKTSASDLSIIDNVNGWVCENQQESLLESLKDLLTHRERIDHCKENLKSFQYQNDTILKSITKIFLQE